MPECAENLNPQIFTLVASMWLVDHFFVLFFQHSFAPVFRLIICLMNILWLDFLGKICNSHEWNVSHRDTWMQNAHIERYAVFFVQRRGISVVSFLIRWIETLQYGDVFGFLLFFLSFSPPAYILVKLSNDFAFIITATVFWYNYYFPLRWAQSKAAGNARTLNRALRSSIGKSLKRPWWYTAFLIRIFCERRVMDELRAFCDCVIFFPLKSKERMLSTLSLSKCAKQLLFGGLMTNLNRCWSYSRAVIN